MAGEGGAALLSDDVAAAASSAAAVTTHSRHPICLLQYSSLLPSIHTLCQLICACAVAACSFQWCAARLEQHVTSHHSATPQVLTRAVFRFGIDGVNHRSVIYVFSRHRDSIPPPLCFAHELFLVPCFALAHTPSQCFYSRRFLHLPPRYQAISVCSLPPPPVPTYHGGNICNHILVFSEQHTAHLYIIISNGLRSTLYRQLRNEGKCSITLMSRRFFRLSLWHRQCS